MSINKPLSRIKAEIYYWKDGAKIIGLHPDITGDVSDITGNVSGIWGNVSDITGDVSDITGDVSGIGGNLDFISNEEREENPQIEFYVKSEDE